MPLITSEQKELDPDWYDNLKPGDYFHTGNPVTCGICGCQSDYWELVRWMVATKLHLICPGNKVDRELHMKIDEKKTCCTKMHCLIALLKKWQLKLFV